MNIEDRLKEAAIKNSTLLSENQLLRKYVSDLESEVNAYRIVLNSGPGVYFLPEVLDPVLIRDWRLIETGVK